MKNFINPIYLLLLLPLAFTGCHERVRPTKEDKLIMEHLGEFPKDKMEKWMPYTGGATLTLTNNTDSIHYTSENPYYYYYEYKPTSKCPPFVNCVEEPYGEEASYEVQFAEFTPDGLDIKHSCQYSWICCRNKYRISFYFKAYNLPIANKVQAGIEYDFSKQVEEYDYDAIFDLLPDTIILESKSIKATLLAGIGISELVYKDTDEVWKVAE